MTDRGAVDVRTAADEATRLLRQATSAAQELRVDEVGEVTALARDIVEVEGLPGLRSEELVVIRGTHLGMALNLDPGTVGVMMLDPGADIEAGDQVRRTGRVMDVPVSEALLGRVVDPRGVPQDGQGRLRTTERYPVERPAPGIFDRRPVEEPLHTGIKVVDAMIPIGRGQRELILGDRQTGKTTVAIDTIVAQKDTGVIAVYCAVGERSASLAKTIAALRARGAMDHTVVVATTGDDPAGLQFIAPYAATSMAEWFMEQGRDVVIVYDDLTRHARAYREVSLLLRRPPGREAYPGDIFYVHSRLLERSTRLTEALGGGSLTALPIVETRAQNIAAYIPTNLISITDGQIYLSPRLFHQGVLPAVDVGRSVSRVGGRAQVAAYREVAGSLRLTHAQFEELERFTRYGARLEGARRRALRRGERVREVLKQAPMSPMRAGEQVAVLVAAEDGAFDDVPLDEVAAAEAALLSAVRAGAADVLDRIERGDALSDDDRSRLVDLARSLGPDGHP